MNEDIFKGKWRQMKGSVQSQWGKLTDDELERINGDRERLLGTIQERYGVLRDEADKQVKDWEKSMAA